MTTVDRPTWDKVWMNMADEIGLRSRCARADIGCVMVSDDNQYVVVGYVGPPADFAPANEDPSSDCTAWCPRSQPNHELEPGYEDCVSCHGEMNTAARANADKIKGGTAYVNGSVCYTCAKVIAAIRLGRVVMKINPQDMHRRPDKVIAFLEASGVKVDIYAPPQKESTK